MKLNLKNGLHYYFYFYDNIHDYHVHYQNYLLQQPKTEDVTNSLKIHENNNSSNTMEVDEKTQNVNIGQEEDNYELNVKNWCKLNSTTTITTFIINNKINFESLPIDYKDEIIDTFFKVNEKAENVKREPSFILYYETYILNKFNEGAENLPPGNIKWCEQNIKTDSEAVTDEQQLVVDDKVTDSKAMTAEQQLVKP
ncbi:uncharacterized protein LOC114129840 [Aphis gossypii]|uniref:uncharacterized protein LOC114129840 n=1 Tax=Aphis gossypii TaxID=80765 RepID=UPI0021590F4D|nr:uncharacterized protein LOC114129840 [Aphis gossypii]